MLIFLEIADHTGLLNLLLEDAKHFIDWFPVSDLNTRHIVPFASRRQNMNRECNKGTAHSATINYSETLFKIIQRLDALLSKISSVEQP